MSATLVLRIPGFNSVHEANEAMHSLEAGDLTLNDVVDDIEDVDIEVVED